jgi:hypothetical protein
LFGLAVSSSEVLEHFFLNNNNTNASSKKARIPPTTLEVMTTGSDETRKDDFVISKTPKTPPTAIRTNTMKFVAYRQNYQKSNQKSKGVGSINRLGGGGAAGFEGHFWIMKRAPVGEEKFQ